MQPRRPPTPRSNRPPGRPPGRPQPQPQDYDENAPVEISAEVVHGPRTDVNSILKVVFFIVGGLAFVAILITIMSSLGSSRAEQQRKEKEEVLDLADYDKAISDARQNMALAMKRFADVEMIETADLSPATNAIARAPEGGAVPWQSPPRPGAPYRSYSFLFKHTDKWKNTHYGFLVVLYYKTAKEVEQASATLREQCAQPAKYCAFKTNTALWWASYQGVNLQGPVADAINAVSSASIPAGLKQFSKRMGTN